MAIGSTANLIKHLVLNILREHTLKVTEVAHSGSGWVLDYGGALRITISQNVAKVSISMATIPHKCTPNIMEAARRDLNTALLKATKQVFGITTI
jgi:hypothetical protein